MRRFEASPRRATPKGHNLHQLHSTAITRTYLHNPGTSAHGTPTPTNSPRWRHDWPRPTAYDPPSKPRPAPNSPQRACPSSEAPSPAVPARSSTSTRCHERRATHSTQIPPQGDQRACRTGDSDSTRAMLRELELPPATVWAGPSPGAGWCQRGVYRHHGYEEHGLRLTPRSR